MGQVIDLCRSSPLFRWGFARGCWMGASAGFVAGMLFFALMLYLMGKS